MMSGADMKLIVVLCVAALVSACATVASSVSYTKGTEALEAKDYETAVVHLEQAVELDPNLSKNHNNLASAYLGVGRLPDAWTHVRRAVLLDPRNQYARMNCGHVFAKMREQTGLGAGDGIDEIREKLGEPDAVHDGTDTACKCVWWQYGSVAVSIVDEKLHAVADMTLR
jgi:tetratricopeptide (TPR) repeat protein